MTNQLDQIGPYRVTGAYPHGGFRAVDANGSRVRIDVSTSPAAWEDWRDRSIQLLRATSIVASLDHAGVARIVGRGVLPDRRPWVASTLAEGVPLSDLLAARGTLSVEETVALIRDLAEIAAHAHARHVVHGTIRPHLVVMRTGERAYPIQLGGWGDVCTHSRDARADVHAIGAIAYRALVGKYPGVVTESVPGVNEPVSTLVTRMLSYGVTALDALAASVHQCGDRVLGGPRFSRPKWTPAPLPDGERVANIIDLAAARDKRS